MNIVYRLLGLLVLAALAVVAVGIFTMATTQGVSGGPPLPGSVVRVVDGSTSCFIVDAGGGKVILIDACQDAAGRSLTKSLDQTGHSPTDVLAVFLTHAHPDHTAGLQILAGVPVYALEAEADLVAGTATFKSPLSRIMGKRNPYPATVHTTSDGEQLTIGDVDLRFFAVPGHTPGSMAILAQGVLFLGDAATIGGGGALAPPLWPFSDDQARGKRSLHALVGRLARETVELVATAHNGNAPASALAKL
jgi:glyoxylase-like metal-dependent hydrolase (beta-lactamase superfamily II)